MWYHYIMSSAASISTSSQKPRAPVRLDRLPHDLWIKIAAYVGQDVMLCSRVSKCIRDALQTFGTTLWYEHHLAWFGPLDRGQDWRVRLIESGHNLQMGMRVKPPSIQETGHITGCVLEGDALVIAKLGHHRLSSVIWSDLARSTTEVRHFFAATIHSLSFQQGVFATVAQAYAGNRLNIWRQGEGPALATVGLKADWLPKESIFCRIGHGRVLLSGVGPYMGTGLSLVDLETGRTVLPFGHHDANVGICGVYGSRALFMDPHLVLASHVYISRGQKASQRLHVWDIRLGFNRAPAQSYAPTEPFCRNITLNSHGQICAATTNVSIGQSHLSLWDTRTLKCAKIVKPKGDVGISALTSMGGVIFSGSNNGVVRCWDSQLKLMGKWVMPKSEQTMVPLIAASPSICVFLTQEVPADSQRREWNLMNPTTLWHAAALPFEPVNASATAAAAAAPAPTTAAANALKANVKK